MKFFTDTVYKMATHPGYKVWKPHNKIFLDWSISSTDSSIRPRWETIKSQ